MCVCVCVCVHVCACVMCVCVGVCACAYACVGDIIIYIDAHPFETWVSDLQGIIKKILKQEDDCFQ